MDITTKYGAVKDACVKSYSDGVFTLGHIKENEYGKYILVGFNVPTKEDPVWRFWVRLEYKDGTSEIKNAELSWDDTISVIRLADEYFGMRT